MPVFSYIAKTSKGEDKEGVLESKDQRQLARSLRQQGLILIKADSENKLHSKIKLNFTISIFEKVSLEEKLFFTRNLQVMISSGLTLPRSLGILAEQTKSKKFQNVLLEMKEKIIKGKSFSDTLIKHDNIFPELFQNMIKVGEEAGTLDQVLKILTEQMEKDHDLRSKIKGAMVYPAVILCAMVGIGVLMLVMVVPQLSSTFEDLNIELPITTKIIIGLADFIIEKWYLMILILVFISIALWQGIKTKKGKKIIDILTLRLPIISEIVKKTNTAYTARTLSSLIASGVPIVRALEITSGTLTNFFYKQAIINASEIVKKGGKLSEALEPYSKIYPITLIQMIAVGEETGETSSILAKLASFFEDEVSATTKNLASVLEPVLMLIIGVAIGFFAISMIQPMYSMLDAI